MEFINEFIRISFASKQDINFSYCNAHEDNMNYYLQFGLFAKDCLFEIQEENYEINIVFVKSYFEKYGEGMTLSIIKQPICCNTQTKLIELIQCKLEGLHRKIFFESNVLYLLYQSQKNNLLFQLQCDQCAVVNKPIEIEKMMNAKKYILENLSESLTIPKIASHVGTNQCYLKKGFKDTFDQTIFEFIQENRMLKARHLLTLPNANVTEISYAVGYSSLSSFSQSYKNYFGISPTEFIKNI